MTRFGYLLAFAAAAWVGLSESVLAQGWGSVKGQFVLDGEAPEPAVLVQQGDATAKDAEVCAAQTITKQDLIVDPDSKGIANIFVYVRKVKEVHPDLKSSKEKEVVFDQKNCQFHPHALFVRTDQKVLVKSDDPIQHNTHTYPLLNMGKNEILAANERQGKDFSMKLQESIPIQVKCDIHPWMLSYWLVLEHPYGAITDAQGRFTIENLPAGEHTFVIYHERTGYVFNKNSKNPKFIPEFKKDFKVKIASGMTVELDPVHIPLARFAE